MKTRDYEKITNIADKLIGSPQYENFEDAEEACQKLMEAVVTPLQKAGDEKWLEFDELIGNAMALYLDQGFINGFRYAMQLKKECDIL